VAPSSGYSMSEGEVVALEFSGPELVQKPMVLVSATGSFANKKQYVALKVRKGESAAWLDSKTLSKIMKIEDGDGQVFWKAVDQKSVKSTVHDSETRILWLPE